jgi:protoporphyrinogen/coproporphyrinogen III oxidase
MSHAVLRHAPDTLTPERPHVVIIGGGITGLSAAYALQRAAGDEVRYTLIERDGRLGGKIVTQTAGDGAFLVEGGPDSFVAQKPQAIELARELGLGDELMASNSLPHTTYVLKNGRPRPLPEGTLLIVPTKLRPFALSLLFTPLGKLRMALDLLIPPRLDDEDESLADFVRRRLGREALETLAEPLMAGIHSADAERQSVMATFGRFRALEKKHGGLIRGMVAVRRTKNQEPRTENREPRTKNQETEAVSRTVEAATEAGGSRFSALASAPFVTLRRGVQSLVDALVERLAGTIHTGRAVGSLAHDPTAAQPYRVRLDDGTTLYADAVVVTTPAYAAAELVAPFAAGLAEALRAIRYVSTGTITLAYRRADVGRVLDGYGVVIPRGEGRRVNAVTLSSVKFRHRAPDDHLLVRVFVGGSRTPQALALDDAALEQLAREEIAAILGITAMPAWCRVFRWVDANPQYDVGHQERVAALEAMLPDGLLLAGAAYGGVGIPDCIRQGQEAAARALKTLSEHPAEV